MAVEIGTASGHIDLLNKLVTFLTTNPDLVAADQNWDVMSTQSSNQGGDGGPVYFLRGRGLAGQDSIHVQMFTTSDPAADWYNIRIHGAAGFNPDAVSLYTGQPGYLNTNVVALMLWNQPIPYWFIANGRRFIVVAKVSTVYQSCYAGFILPLAPPSEYPYPLAIGGMRNGDARWSDSGAAHLSYINPNNTLYLLRPELSWLGFQNYFASGSNLAGIANHNVWPTRIYTIARPSPDGSYALTPLVLRSDSSSGNVYGELDGVRKISGFANASENTQVVDGVTWLTVQDGFRTGQNFYYAVALE